MKMFLSFFISVAVLFASIATPAQQAVAISPHVVITHVQAGGSGAATQEVIVLYNNGDADSDVTDWCLTNKNGAKIFCFSNDPGRKTVLPGKSFATIVSVPYSLSHAGKFPSQFTPISQSSGGITGGGDTVSLIDNTLMEVDKVSWSSSLAGGSHLVRKMSDALDTLTYIDTDTQGDWSVVVNGVIPADESHTEMFDVDVCTNMEGVQPAVPEGMVLDSAGKCVEKQVYELLLTEALPNANGADAGSEFIELYNPNDIPIGLSDYMLLTGPQLSDAYVFSPGLTVEPYAYVYFSNAEIKFNLLNTSSRVSLTMTDGTIVSEMPAYEDPEEGSGWALIDEEWRYTTTPTPGEANILTLPVAISAIVQPCAPNQYRSTETNRCRLLTTATIPTPCKVGQYRNEETGRCRAIASDAKTTAPCGLGQIRNAETNRCRKVATAAAPASCKEGQERNAETNRCRNVTKMTNAGYGVLGAEKKNDANWYVLVTVVGILLLALAYAAWEWHEEAMRGMQRMRLRALRFVRLSK